MNDWIRVLIVDDIEETRTNIRKILSFDQRMEVVGEADNGLLAIEMTEKYQPDVILMDINMPDMDGLQATEQILIKSPKSNVIMISVQGETDYLKRAMAVGAKEFIIKPFSPDDLIQTITNVYERSKVFKKNAYAHHLLEEGVVTKPRVITFFSGSGGIGKTALAVNLGVALAEAKKRVAILDLDLLFGDVAHFLDITPKRTIYYVAQEVERIDGDGLYQALYHYTEQLHVLPAPIQPEHAEYILARQVERMIRLLKENYDYIIIDTPANFSDVVLSAFDQTDYLLLVTNRTIHSLKNNRRVLDVLNTLNYDLAKIRSIINESTVDTGLSLIDIKGVLEIEEYVQFPEDQQISGSINQGRPMLTLQKSSRWSKQIHKLATRILEENERKEGRKRWFKKLA